MAHNVFAELQTQVKSLKWDKVSLLQQTTYLAEPVCVLGAFADLPPSPAECRKRQKMVASGAWPASCENAHKLSYKELGGRLKAYYILNNGT